MISRTVAKGQPIADWRVPSNNPTNNCGTYFGSSPLLVSKEAKLSFLSNIKYFIFKPSTAILTATSVNLFSDEMTILTGSEKEAWHRQAEQDLNLMLAEKVNLVKTI